MSLALEFAAPWLAGLWPGSGPIFPISIPSTVLAYQNNTTARISAIFTDASGIPVDPGTITLQVQPPRGQASTTYTYPATVTKDGSGQYHADVLLNSPGIWWYRWSGTATDQVAAEQSIQVLPTQIGGLH